MLQKVDIFRDEIGRFARYDHLTVLNDKTVSSISARFPNDVSQSSAFTDFFTHLKGVQVDTRIFPYGVNVKQDVYLKAKEGVFIGRDSLSFSPKFLKHSESLDVGTAIGDYAYQNIILGHSDKYHSEMLNGESLKQDKAASEKELEGTEHLQRYVFRQMVSYCLSKNNTESAKLRENHPHTAKLVDTFLSGGYFRKTA